MLQLKPEDSADLPVTARGSQDPFPQVQRTEVPPTVKLCLQV